jgi:hypothetical protein
VSQSSRVFHFIFAVCFIGLGLLAPASDLGLRMSQRGHASEHEWLDRSIFIGIGALVGYRAIKSLKSR